VSDYLFDKAGRDPEIEQLEALLSPLAYRGAAPALPRRRPLWVPVVLAAAAAAMIAVLLWPRSWMEGPRVVRVTDIGTVALGPDTRARMIGREQVELDHGRLSARISAPPRRFSVKTRHVTVIDLGCAFELEVDREGRGKLVVTEGSVALSDGMRETVVPAGGACAFDEHGAGAPSLPQAKPQPLVEPKTPATIAPVQPKPVSIPEKAAPAKRPAPAKKQAAPVRRPAKKAAPVKPAATDHGIHLEHDPLRDLRDSAPR
jgi:hypothetical protein